MARRNRNGSSAGPRTWSRDWIILVLFAVFLAVLAGRLFYIQVVKASDFSQQAATAHTRDVVIEARRGTIYDRNGEVLASNVDATTVYVDPQEVDQPEGLASVLADVLGKEYDKTYEDYYKLVTKDNSFTYIQRKCDKDLADTLKERLKQADIDGIHYLEDTKRVYPYGDTGSQVIGNVDVDGNGIAGLELEYDDLVGGQDGQMSVESGRKGIPIADGVISKTDAVNGEDIVTSLDIKLQQRVEKSLLQAIEDHEAQGGNALVMDAATGEIYASCSYAKTEVEDEDGKKKEEYQLEVGKLASVTDSYEPGSTFKAITVESILANSSVDESSTFTVPDKLKVYDATIKDSHEHETEKMTLEQIIADSSNVGTVLASRKVDADKLYETYASFGFGTDPGTDFPGTASGQLQEASEWDPVRAANIVFGQGVTVTNAQMARAFGALEQGGVAHVPHFLTSIPKDQDKSDELIGPLTQSQTIADKETCERVTKLLRSVVTDGTGTDAAIEGYTVVGKTGTAQIAENGTYGHGNIVSFAGWLEGSSSNLICVVSVNKPGTGADGGTVCGPVFADIMSFAIERYQINPNAS